MPRRSHEAQGGPGFGERPPAVDDRFQFSRRKTLHHSPQDPSHPGRLGFFQHVQFQDGVGHVGTHRRHLFLAQDVSPGHLHEPAALLEAGEAGLDEALSRQAVQHHVHARAFRSFENLLSEGRRAAVEYVFHPQRPEIGLLRRAGGGEDLRSRRLHPLDGRQTDAARTRVNQHALSGRQS